MAGAVLVGTRGVTTGSSLTTGAGASSANATFAACISLGNAGAVSTVTDNKGNTYTKRGATSRPSGRTDINATEIWVVDNGVGGAGHALTVTFTNSSVFAVGHLIEVQGVPSTAPVDVVIAANQAAVPPLVINTGTLSQADEIILVLASVVSPVPTATYTDGTGTYSLLSQETDNNKYWTSSVWTKVVASTASTATSITVSEGSSTFPAGNLITFKVASSASPSANFNYAHKSGDTTAAATTSVSASSATSSFRGILVASATIVAGAITAAAAIVGSAGLTDASSSTQISAQSQTARVAGSLGSASSMATTLSAATERVSGTTDSGAAPAVGAHGEAHHLQGPVQNLLQVPVSTQPSGSTFLVFHTGLQGNSDPTDNKANTLSRLTPWTAQPLWPSYGVEMFGVVSGVGGSDHVFTIDKVPSTRPDEEASAIAVEVVGGTQIIGPSIGYVATASPPYATPTVTVDGPATVFALWAGENGGGPHTVSASDGFTFVDGWLGGVSGSIQFALFSKTVTNAGTYGTTFTSTPTQGGLFGICAVRGGSAGPAATLSISSSAGLSKASAVASAAATSTVSASAAMLAQPRSVSASASVPPFGSISAASDSARAQALLDASASVGIAFGAAQASRQPATVISANTAILASSEASASGSLNASAQSGILASSNIVGRSAELSASAAIPIPGQILASFVYSVVVGDANSASTISVSAGGSTNRLSVAAAAASIGIAAQSMQMAKPSLYDAAATVQINVSGGIHANKAQNGASATIAASSAGVVFILPTPPNEFILPDTVRGWSI